MYKTTAYFPDEGKYLNYYFYLFVINLYLYKVCRLSIPQAFLQQRPVNV